MFMLVKILKTEGEESNVSLRESLCVGCIIWIGAAVIHLYGVNRSALHYI
jgi:hypothetical protein